MSIAAGTKLGRYEIRSKLGAGGMGEVYLALDTKLDRKVAVKILPAEVAAHPDRMKRFVQEAKAASALNHPNIITIYEIDETESGHFIAIEFIEGETLRESMRNALMKLAAVIEVAAQVAGALSAAHAAGIVHRDIKPENIMLRRDGIVKVLDFGLAKLTQPEASTINAEAATKPLIQTEPGSVMGTVAYMSPEQVRGIELDARTDVWSLGVVLYEMLAGQAPFAGETSSHIGVAILEKEPMPLVRYASQLPADLQRIVRKTLAKDRDDRYQSARDLLIDLKTLRRELDLQSEIERSLAPSVDTPPNTTQAAPETKTDSLSHTTGIAEPRPTSSAQYVVTGIKRHKLKAIVALLIVVAAAAGLWWYFHLQSRAVAIESLAVMPFVNASGNSEVDYLSDGMTEMLITSLSQLPKLSVKARSSVFRYKGKDTSPPQVGRELNVQAILTGRLVQHGNDLTLHIELVDAKTETALWSADYNRSMTNLVALQGEIARDVSEKLRLRLTNTEQQRLTKRDTQNAEAYQAYLKGLYYWHKGLAPGYEKSRDYFQQAIDLDPSYALAYSGLADYYGFAAATGLLPPDDNWPKAEAAANKALALDDTLAEPYNPLAAVNLYYYRDWPAAEHYFRRGIELDPNYAEIHIHYANCLSRFGRNDEALTEIQRAIELEPLSPRPNLGRSRILFFMRQYDRAIDQFRKTLGLEPNFALAHEWLGNAYEQKGIQREAIAEWGKALTLRGEEQQASILERTFATSGFEAAIRALTKQQLERLNERMKRGEYVPAFEYVSVYTRLGDKEQAFTWLDKAVQERNAFEFEVRVNPIYDSLRDDPRFQESLRRAGLPQ